MTILLMKFSHKQKSLGKHADRCTESRHCLNLVKVFVYTYDISVSSFLNT